MYVTSSLKLGMLLPSQNCIILGQFFCYCLARGFSENNLRPFFLAKFLLNSSNRTLMDFLKKTRKFERWERKKRKKRRKHWLKMFLFYIDQLQNLVTVPSRNMETRLIMQMQRKCEQCKKVQ